MKTFPRFIIALFLFISANEIFLQADSLSAIRKLVETGNDGISCTSYKITDGHGKNIKIPADLSNDLKCLFRGISFSPDYNYVLFSYDDSVKVYDFVNDTTILVKITKSGAQGINMGEWSKSGSFFFFTEIDQQNFHEMGRIYVYSFSEGKCKLHSTIDAPFDFTCASTCVPNRNAIQFDGENMIKYRRNENLGIDPGKIVEVKFSE